MPPAKAIGPAKDNNKKNQKYGRFTSLFPIYPISYKGQLILTYTTQSAK
jgi:hypothetical protein